jgi:hypothetical protein
VTQGDEIHGVMADLGEGGLTLKESHDGQSIAATWLGQLTPFDCGRPIEVQRSPAGQKGQAFKLQRLP